MLYCCNASERSEVEISLKGNQSTMHDEIKLFFDDAIKRGNRALKKASSTSCEHGRVEKRICWQSDCIDWFEDKDKWDGLRSICMVESTVYKKATVLRTEQYNITAIQHYSIQSNKVDHPY